MKCLKTIFPVVGLLLSSLALPQLAAAADCTVENGDNDGAGSLRNCVEAVALEDGDTITIPADLTINLSANALVISNAIKIIGAGADSSIIDASGMDNVEIFSISALNKPAVEISGLSLQNAQEHAIIVQPNSVLKVSNSAFDSNKADDNDAHGGAILNGGSLLVDNSEFTNNQATLSGGAITNLGGNLNIKNSHFRTNSITAAGSRGGAIYQADGIAEIFSSNFDDNFGGATSGGGAIGIEGGSFYIEASELSNNQSGLGGAIGSYESTLLEIKSSRLTGNSGYAGGAIFSDSQILLENSEVSENRVSEFGGAIASFGDLIVKNSVIRGNKALDPENDVIFGGAIGIEGNSLSIENSTIEDNEAFESGAIYNCTDNTLILNSSIAHNKAVGFTDNQEGVVGAIGHYCGYLLISNSTISGNLADSDAGAILSQTESGSLVLNNVTISNNIADANADGNGAGGGLYNHYGSVSISNSIIAGNQDAGEQDNSGPDCYTPEETFILVAANNIIQDPTGCTIGGNIAGVLNVDPLLDPNGLQDNGGPTQTIALTAGSPALDGGDDGSCELADQRGVTRPQGDSCDLGAYEAGPMAELDPDLDFGEIELDSDSISQIVTLSNTGLVAIDVNDILIDGDFSQTNNCGATLDAGTSCQFEVIFSPTQTGPRTGSLSVETSAGTLSVSLTGIGIEAPVVPNLVDVSGSGFGCSISSTSSSHISSLLFLALGLMALLVIRKKRA